MLRICLALLCGLLMLVGCSSNVPAAAPPAVSDTAQFSATATPQLVLVTTPTPDADGVWHSPLDNMPIIMGRADMAPKLVDGVLRSPLDTMPILPGDPRTAPMPNLAGPPLGPTPSP
jgi:hypothetical protein